MGNTSVAFFQCLSANDKFIWMYALMPKLVCVCVCVDMHVYLYEDVGLFKTVKTTNFSQLFRNVCKYDYVPISIHIYIYKFALAFFGQ